VPLAEEVQKLTAVCTVCGAAASFSRRIGSETQVEVIGGADKYIAACRSCFFHESLELPEQASPPVSPVKTEADEAAASVAEAGEGSGKMAEGGAEGAAAAAAPHPKVMPAKQGAAAGTHPPPPAAISEPPTVR
jgi:hypothetical protein